MNTFTYLEAKNNFSKIIDMVKTGEEIIVNTAKGNETIAVIVPYTKYKKKKERPLGILKGKARYKMKGNFKITNEELLSS